MMMMMMMMKMMMKMITTTLSARWTTAALLSLLLLLLLSTSPSFAALPCSTDEECSIQLREGSFCSMDGFCSNPFVKGCLQTTLLLPDDHESSSSSSSSSFTGRACNSDDLQAGVDGSGGDCIDYTQTFGYPEIRIHNGNWESSIFIAWILQILLMEVLHVPVTVGLTTDTTAISSFYSPSNQLAYSAKAYPFEALRNAKDCQDTNEECAHFMPEVWNGQLNEWNAALSEGYIDPLEGNGQVGKGSWYVPAFTAARDESLLSFFGLRGERNRQKLANDFRKPTSWGDYCEQVSTDNCTNPENDTTAPGGYPPDASHAARYFAPPHYIGHFRVTDENNCTLNPDTCMGNIVGPSCTWSTNIDAQLYWNDIKLLPDGPIMPNGGYSYSALIEIWRAANATKSNLLLWWWRPEALVEEFHGTDAQFQQVLLPEATDICSRARVATEDRCSEDIMERRGDPDGACDQEAHALQKVFSKAFAEASEAAPIAVKSPGYDLMKALKITDLEVNNMLRRWISIKVDPYGNDAREAVCSWVVDNLDMLLDFVPAGYPKQLSEKSSYNTAVLHTAQALAGLTTLAVIGTALSAILFRKTRVFIYAQSHIVALILVGFFLVGIASILVTLEPSNGICVAQTWLVNLGYTVELVPLLVKIAAINKILTSAKKMKRVQISRRGMLYNVGLVVCVVVAFLTVWTVLDPPQKVEQRVLPDERGIVIETSLTCNSEKDFWIVLALGWQALLLLMASVLAFQSRDTVQEFNESRSLGTMIYSHLMFLVLRGIVYNLGKQEVFLPNVVAAVTSFLLSLDTVFAICIYLVPKCIEAKVAPNGDPSRVSGGGKRNSIQGRSSVAVTEIEARALAARMSYDAASTAAPQQEYSDSNGTNYIAKDGGGALSLSQRTNGSRTRPTSKFSGIPEESCESESEDNFRPAPTGAAGIDFPAGSYRTDLSGAVIRTPPGRQKKQGSLRLLTKKLSQNRGLSSSHDDGKKEIDSTSSDGLSLSHIGDVLMTRGIKDNAKTRQQGGQHLLKKMPSIKASSLRLHHLEKIDISSDDGEDSSEEFDTGGPRFSNLKMNKELERSVRMPSMHDLDLFDGSDSDASVDCPPDSGVTLRSTAMPQIPHVQNNNTAGGGTGNATSVNNSDNYPGKALNDLTLEPLVEECIDQGNSTSSTSEDNVNNIV